MTSTEITASNTLAEVELAKIAERIRARVRRTAEDIVAIGQDLAEVKVQLGHGKFLDWINHEFGMSERSARNYMSVAAWAADKSATVADLAPSTLYLLAAPSTPEDIEKEVITRVEKGENIKAAEVKRQIQKAKAESTNVATTEGEAPETEVSIDSAIAYFEEPATSREHGIRKIREYEAFADHVAADAARAAQEERPESEGLPPEPKPSEGPPKKPCRSRQEIERDTFSEGRLPQIEAGAGVAIELPVPKLNVDDAQKAIAQIKKAEVGLRHLRREIEKQHPKAAGAAAPMIGEEDDGVGATEVDPPSSPPLPWRKGGGS